MILKLLQPKISTKKLPDRIRLEELGLWRQKSRIHQRVPKQEYQYLLNMTKEKCYRHDTPPRQERCDECLASNISEKQVYMRREVCLPRIMGLAIEKDFDGIHHGYEIADIKYRDVFGELSIELGIHLKSRTKSRPRGLGRSVYVIKSLYTQVFYSLQGFNTPPLAA